MKENKMIHYKKYFLITILLTAMASTCCQESVTNQEQQLQESFEQFAQYINAIKEQGIFVIRLVSFGQKKDQVMALLHELFSNQFSEQDCLELLATLPLGKQDAQQIKTLLEQVGATVELEEVVFETDAH